ncbi:hypothetical protein [Pseudomonas sp. Bi70]|uniref:hypothetical protein n=1 Tax=Pseudomonas sp. Bi70 TaxID=2821127 RepID=UPI001E4042DC|nr:hypothetical protein [Pseudomonas sp. Bi70]
MISILKFLSLSSATAFFCVYLFGFSGGNISEEFEAEFVRSWKKSLVQYIILDDKTYSAPYSLWSNNLKADMFYKFNKGEQIKVRVDEGGRIASLEARGEQLVSITDYEVFKKEASSRYQRYIFFCLGLYAVLWLMGKRLQN